MKELDDLRKSPSDFVHREDITVEKILSLFMKLESLLLMGKHNFGYCSIMNKCEKCKRVCDQMRDRKVIPDEVIAELIHTGKDVIDNPWVGPSAMVQIGRHKRDCSKCKESDQIHNSCSKVEPEIWAGGIPHKVKL